MKNLIRSAALTLAFIASTAAQATTFNYSYTFATGELVTGSFDGTANGNLVTGLSNIYVSVNGTAFPSNGSLGAYSLDQTSGDWTGKAVVSFDGLESNFTFTTGDPTSITIPSFLLVPYGNGYTELAQLYFNGSEPSETVSYARWQLTAAVPEPETYAMLLAGLGMLGFMAGRRRMQ